MHSQIHILDSQTCVSQAVYQPENVMCLGHRKAHVLHVVLHYYTFNNHWQLWTYGKKATVLCYAVISLPLHFLLEQVNSLGTAFIPPNICLKYQFNYQYQKYSLASKFMWKESHWNYQNFWGKRLSELLSMEDILAYVLHMERMPQPHAPYRLHISTKLFVSLL
jgi:hypothetical protein